MSGTHRLPALVASSVLAVAAVWLVAGSTGATAQTAIAARWPMDETTGATVMRDVGPFGLDGAIGDDVETGGGHYSFTWPWNIQPAELPASVERVVVVDDAPALDPDLEDFEIEFRYRTNQNYGNVLQKGQNTTVGGYFKIEQPFGFTTCLFKDEAGVRKAVQARTSTSDGEWHTIRCEFDRGFGDFGRLRLFVDGDLDQINTLTEPLGRIANDRPLTIGGKYQCNQVTVECDYFKGDVDEVTIRRTFVASGPPGNDGIRDGATAGAVAIRGESTAIDG